MADQTTNNVFTTHAVTGASLAAISTAMNTYLGTLPANKFQVLNFTVAINSSDTYEAIVMIATNQLPS